MRKPLLALFIFACVFPCSLSAQHYRTALGLRVGSGNLNRSLGITLQQRLSKKWTLEGIAQTDLLHSATFHLLAERHTSLITNRLNFYWGGGMSFGWEQASSTDGKGNTSEAGVGLDLIAGLELTLARVNVSLDYKPNISLSDRTPWLGTQVGISIRPVLRTERQAKKRQKAREKEKRRRQREKEQGDNPKDKMRIDLWPFD